MNSPGVYFQLMILVLWILWLTLINTNWQLVRKHFISNQLNTKQYHTLYTKQIKDIHDFDKKSDIRLWQRSSPPGRQTVSGD